MRAHHGVISDGQARALGATGPQIRRLLARGTWRRARTGVYVPAGEPDSPLLSHATALAGAGAGAILSHRSAAWLWDLVAEAPSRIELTVPAGRRPRLAGVTVHRRQQSPRPVSRRGLAVTDPDRTLLDFACSATPLALSQAVDRAITGQRALTSLARLQHVIAGPPPIPGGLRPAGVGVLRDTLCEHGYGGAPAPSVLEARMSRLFRRERVPLPQAQVELALPAGALPAGDTADGGEAGRYRLDYAWPHVKLAVEVNGYAWHHTPDHARHDHARHNRLQASGWTVLVYTWKDVVEDGHRVATEIMAHLRRLAA